MLLIQKDVRATFCFKLPSYSLPPCFDFVNTYWTANLNQVLCRLLGEQDELSTVPDHKEFKSTISYRPLRARPWVSCPECHTWWLVLLMGEAQQAGTHSCHPTIPGPPSLPLCSPPPTQKGWSGLDGSVISATKSSPTLCPSETPGCLVMMATLQPDKLPSDKDRFQNNAHDWCQHQAWTLTDLTWAECWVQVP